MARRCPKCHEQWPDLTETCPLDGEPLETLEIPNPSVDAGSGESDPGEPPARLRGSTAAIQIGDRLGRYRITSVLAKGSAATVFRGRHETLDREVAIKVLHRELTHHPDLVARFFAEAQAVNRIGHPNIVEITDFVEGGQHPPYMVMELLHGQDLRDYLLSNAPLSGSEAVAIAVKVCDAVGAAHKLDIVHRDLKAENIFLRPVVGRPPGVTLLDFGIAKWLTQAELLPETLTGEVVGTPEYMSPEQIQGVKLDARTDIYALGVLLYEMVTDELPFNADMIADLLHKQMNEAPRPPSEWLAEKGLPPLPPLLEETILKCLAKDRRERFQTMEELRLTLEMAVDQADIHTLPVSLVSAKRTRPWLVAAGAACILALAAGGIMLYTRSSKHPASGENPARGLSNRANRASSTVSGSGPGAPATRPLVIASEPSQASVFRLSDGKFLGITPLRLDGPPTAPERFLVRLRGHSQTTVAVSHKSSGTVRVTLKPEPPPPQPPQTPAGPPRVQAGTAASAAPAASGPSRREDARPGRRTASRARKPRKPRAAERSPLKDEWGIADPFKK